MHACCLSFFFFVCMGSVRIHNITFVLCVPYQKHQFIFYEFVTLVLNPANETKLTVAPLTTLAILQEHFHLREVCV
jgi:hypothetical protein